MIAAVEPMRDPVASAAGLGGVRHDQSELRRDRRALAGRPEGQVCCGKPTLEEPGLRRLQQPGGRCAVTGPKQVVRCVIEQILINEPISGAAKDLMCLTVFAPGAEGCLPQQGFTEEVMAAIPLPAAVRATTKRLCRSS